MAEAIEKDSPSEQARADGERSQQPRAGRPAEGPGGGLRAENRRRIAAYFASGAKDPADCDRLGVEVEHFVVAADGASVPYEPAGGRLGVREVLEQIEPWYPEASYSADGRPVGLAGKDGSVTLEPAAQLELSAAPFSRVADIEGAFERFYGRVRPILEKAGCRLQNAGYHPTRRALDMPLIPKQRYRFMDGYFAHIGSHGERMMRASASTQVSVDFSSEADAVRKMRVAAALAPVLAAVMDNTRVFEAEPNTIPLRRLQLWREVDDRRCGTPRGLFSDGFGFGDYADWLLDTPPIFVDRPAADDPEGPALRAAFDIPAAEAYADAPMEKADVEHLMSMFWPDVRLKRFVEIRPADSVPLPQVLGYAALVEGLFYHEESLAAVEDALGVRRGGAGEDGAGPAAGGASPDHWPLDADAVNGALREIQARGFEGDVYGFSLARWEDLLFELARGALPPEEAAYLAPLEEFARAKDWWRPGE